MARYMDGNAVRYEEAGYQPAQPAARPSFLTVVEGNKLSGALSPFAVTLCKCAVAFAATLVVVSLVRILLITAAFSFSTQNKSLSSELETARATASELEVQQSMYGNKDRVWSLATEVYGMDYAAETVNLDLARTEAE